MRPLDVEIIRRKYPTLTVLLLMRLNNSSRFDLRHQRRRRLLRHVLQRRRRQCGFGRSINVERVT